MSNCLFCVCNAVNVPKLQLDILCISRILVFSITMIIFDSMTLFDVTLHESTWTISGRVEIMHTTC